MSAATANSSAFSGRLIAAAVALTAGVAATVYVHHSMHAKLANVGSASASSASVKSDTDKRCRLEALLANKKPRAAAAYQ
eukprot:1056862-Pleurochrysis_carterae.AAC.1